MENKENIPAEVLDWIEHIDFHNLTVQQQQTVLQYLTAAGYQQLHDSAMSARSARQMLDFDDTPARQKLLDHFQATHHRQSVGSELQYWRAAALFLLLVTGILTVALLKYRQTPTVATLVKTDTIFTPTLVQAVGQPVHDTVYLSAAVPTHPSPHIQPHNKETKSFTPRPAITPQPANTGNDFHIVTTSNKYDLKNNSIKDDSLVQNFHFVSL